MTQEQQDEAQELGGLMFSEEEISLIVGLATPEELNLTALQLSITKGRLMQEAAVRREIFKHAKGGSAPAAEQALRLIENARVNNAGR